MIRLDANLKWLFNEVPFMDRFAAAARAGFSGVEFSLPYIYPKHAIRQQLDAHGLRYCYLVSPSGDWEAGERGIACVPGREREFQDGFDLALDYAHAFDCDLVHTTIGLVPADGEPLQCREVLMENLERAARRARASGVRIAIEPLCRQSYPRALVKRTAEAAAIIAELGHANVGIVYDFHHAQREEGDLIETIRRHLSRILHFQIANAPGRTEPGVGEVNFPFLLDRIDALGYTGWIGCEYTPSVSTLSSLGWAKPYGIRVND
ncbi:hydroxypyruvate isomerase family protein [Variovorax boronicumulans]|uniref:hydroxypyruvate isomerase family protein n=1 Tax=Variovorax boronicumulans TaxID=436515 RepID=UPI001C585FC4